MSYPSHQTVPNRTAAFATWLIALSILGTLGCVVAGRRGSLAWDDADYLRRGLANARASAADGPVMFIPRAIGSLLHEHPKPPWLVGWIQLGSAVIGRQHLDGLILFATIIPYAFLLAAVVLVGRWLAGVWGGLAALVCVISSPASLAFGGKVMVETFLSLWVLLTFGLTCRLLEHPARKRGIALGLVVGLSLLTKLTTILFLPIPLLFVIVRVVRGPERQTLLKSLAWSAIVCAVVAGPWYVLNASKAVKFARFSSQYNLIAEGRLDRVGPGQRIASMAAEVPGWPMAVTLTCTIVVAAVVIRGNRPHGDTELLGANPEERRRLFSAMAWIGAGTAGLILLFPAYFDPRFLLPIWPVLAVDVGRRLSPIFLGFPPFPRLVLGGGLAACLLSSVFAVASAPAITTYWSTAGLIDDLVRDYGISTLGNVGNCAEWNVCKTGLVNELRDRPENCFVLHDLTKLSADDALRHLARFDAVVVLGQAQLPESQRRQAPGLNRAYDRVADTLAKDSTFVRVTPAVSAGLPQLAVYIHQRSGEYTKHMATKSSRKRRL